MPAILRIVLLIALGLAASVAQAADPPGRRACLTKAEQRAAVASRQAVPLTAAVKSAGEHIRRGELLRARLCHRGDGLVYELTLLGHTGKVRHATVDAENGHLLKSR
jgi:uncharacterized membrane protein YkoI